MLNRTGKAVTFLLLPWLAYGYGTAFYDVLVSEHWRLANVLQFVVGVFVFVVFWILFRRFLQILCTFEHEMTHLIVGLLFLKIPKSFNVTFNEGGYVEMYGGKNFLVTLAPYYLPTICYLLLPLAWVLPGSSQPLFFGILGGSMAFHLISGWQEFHFGQSDLHDAGLIFSVLFLPVANLVFTGAILSFVIGGNERFMSFWKMGIVNGLNLIR